MQRLVKKVKKFGLSGFLRTLAAVEGLYIVYSNWECEGLQESLAGDMLSSAPEISRLSLVGNDL